jgi:hypothetical protein
MLLAAGSAIFLHERAGVSVRSNEPCFFSPRIGAALISTSSTGSDSGPQPTLKGDLLVLLSVIAGLVMTLATRNLKKIVIPPTSILIVSTGLLLGYAGIWQPLNYRMTELIDRYRTHYGSKKASADREKSIVEGIRSELGRKFVREVDRIAVQRRYEKLTELVTWLTTPQCGISTSCTT